MSREPLAAKIWSGLFGGRFLITLRLLAVPLVSKMCPSDVYRVWKRGESLRVDTSLLGFEHMTWQRGRRSFIFRGQGELWGTCCGDRCVGALRFSCGFLSSLSGSGD